MSVTNQYNREIDYESAVGGMDDKIREDIHMHFAPCTEQEFFDEYCKRHQEKYGEEFEWNKRSPQV